MAPQKIEKSCGELNGESPPKAKHMEDEKDRNCPLELDIWWIRIRETLHWPTKSNGGHMVEKVDIGPGKVIEVIWWI